jgi:dTDP-4-dehydrorhamnose reductase
MKKFLILGGDSVLAKNFQGNYSAECVVLNKIECDITNAKALEGVIKKTKCKYILNCAAITDIEYCETNPKKCFDVNSIAVYQLSRLCHKYNRKLIHFSSDYAINPVNVYGHSKFVSEKSVDPLNTLTIRTSFYSPDYYIIKSLLANKKTQVYKNMYFNPVSVTRLVKEIYKNKDRRGLLNIFTDRKISKYDFAKKVIEIFNLDKKLIRPETYTKDQRHAQRPLDSFVKSDVKISLDEDLSVFKCFLNEVNRKGNRN